ncbi:hypothetical protein D3C87_2141680 [compost metagenome]
MIMIKRDPQLADVSHLREVLGCPLIEGSDLGKETARPSIGPVIDLHEHCSFDGL